VTYMRLVEGGSPALGNGEGKGYVEICEGLSVKTWSVSHGHCIENHNHRGSNAGLGYMDISSQLDASPRSSSGGGNLTPGHMQRYESHERICVYDSSVYFIRDIATGCEVLIFGDVEPDSISLSPRNLQVWAEAAPKIASGQLGGIFIECSYDDSQSDDTLFGHLAPRFLIEELKVLADLIEISKSQEKDKDTKKRKRWNNGNHLDQGRRRSARKSGGYATNDARQSSPQSPRSQVPLRLVNIEVTQADGSDEQMQDSQGHTANLESTLPIRTIKTMPLKGVKIVIIHMKDKLDDDSDVGETILKQLKKYDEQACLGCEFVVSKVGQALYL